MRAKRAAGAWRRLRRARRSPVLATGLCAALALSTSSARAQPAAEGTDALRRFAHVLERLELRGEWMPSLDPLDRMSANLHIQKGTGFEYRRRLELGEKPVELGLQGPIVRKKKGLGLTLVVRF